MQACSKFDMSHQAKISEPCNVPHRGYAGTDRRTGSQAAGQLRQSSAPSPLAPHPTRRPNLAKRVRAPVHTPSRGTDGPPPQILASRSRTSMHGSHAARLPSSGPNSFGPASAGRWPRGRHGLELARVSQWRCRQRTRQTSTFYIGDAAVG
jgi:hypothetical protein